MSRFPYLAIDTECTGLDHRRGAFPYAVATCDLKGGTWFTQWPVDPFSRKVKPNRKEVRFLKRVITNHTPVFHNAKFDIRMLTEVKAVNGDRIWRRYEDTILAGHVVNAADVPHRLKDLAIKYLEIEDDDEKELRDRVKSIRINEARELGWTLGQDIEMDYWMPMELHRLGRGEKGDDKLLEKYNRRDVERTMLLWMMYEGILESDKLWLPYRREKTLQKTIYRMKTRGVTLLKGKLDRELSRYSKEANKHELTCVTIACELKNWPADVNIGSGPQLNRLLFTDPPKRKRNDDPEQTYGFQLNPLKSTKTGFSTDKHVMPLLLTQAKKAGKTNAATFIEHLLAYRKNEKAVSDLKGYLAEAIPTKLPNNNTKHVDWRLHGDVKQTGTQTTRCSHSNPNTANISKGDKLDKDDAEADFTTREVFGPSWNRRWYAMDYNQLQLRIFAKVAGEEAFTEALRKGYDAHTWVATQIFECSMEQVDKFRRRIAKNVNFGFIFGAGEKKIDFTSGIRGLSKKIAKLFPNAHDFMRQTISYVRRHGHVMTLGGYRLPVDPSFAYAGVCYIVQGTEGDIVKNAMIDIDQYLENATRDEAFITLQVHDELVFDFPRDGNRHEHRRSLPKEHRKHLAEIARLMIKAGADLGVETPVSCEKIVTDYNSGVKQEIGEIYVRRYRRTGQHTGQVQKTGGGRNYPGRARERRKHRLVHKV